MRSTAALLLVLFAQAFAIRAAHADACADLEAEADAVLALRDADPAQGLTRGEAALATAATLDLPCPVGEAMLHSAVGGNLHILGRNNDAVERYRRALDLLPGNATPTQRATIHRGAGVALADMESYESALEHYLTALATSRTAGETLEAAKTAGNIGNLYSTLGQLDRSRNYHEQALRDFEAAGFKPGVAGTLINLGALAAKFANAAQESGNAAEERRENEALRDHNLRALAIFTELGNERGIAYAESNIALAYERLGDPSLALAHHERALELRRRIGDVHGQINSHITLTSTLISLGRLDAARAQLDQAQALLPADNDGLAVAIAERRVELAEARGDFRDALHWQREVTRLNTKLAGDDHNARIAELQERFDSDQRAREIELLRSNAEIRDLELRRRTLLLQVSLAFGVLLAILFAVLYSRLRLGRRTAMELERMARTDAVTGLANRRHMIEKIEHERQRARRSGLPFSLLMIDLDRFKAINDQHGHDIGDIALVEAAKRMAGELRGQDALARWGGEEFLVLLPDTGLAGARTAAEKLRIAVSMTAMPVPGHDASVALSVTIGAAECTQDMSIDDCVRAADEAMYAGKRQGRDQVVALAS